MLLFLLYACYYWCTALVQRTASDFIAHFWLSFGSNELGNKKRKKKKNLEINGFQSINWVQSWQILFKQTQWIMPAVK